MNCSGDSEILHQIVRDTTRKSEKHELIRVVSRTISCSISESPLKFLTWYWRIQCWSRPPGWPGPCRTEPLPAMYIWRSSVQAKFFIYFLFFYYVPNSENFFHPRSTYSGYTTCLQILDLWECLFKLPGQ